ncbi:MAG: AsmA family protein [Chitinispirillaceae bacterium]
MTVQKKTLMIIGGVVTLVTIAVITALLLFDINSYKSEIETAASGTTGLEVRINGKMRLALFPFSLAAKDIHIAGKKGEILSIERFKLRADLPPLLRKQLKITSCELVKPVVSIVKDAEGNYNFESPGKKSSNTAPGPVFALNSLKLSNGAIVYCDETTGNKTELKGINCAIKDFSASDGPGGVIKNVAFTGSFGCKEFLQKDLRLENFNALIKADKGMFSLKPFTVDVFGGKGEGEIAMDWSAYDPSYTLKVKIAKLDFEKIEELFRTKKVIGGKCDLSASLTMKEKNGRFPVSNLNGAFGLRGDNLVMYIMDLDKVLASYETSQKFHLVDLAGFFIAGPLSAVALKGYRYGDIYYQAHEGQGAITQFISHWKIRDGEAEATDCALATFHNRAALKGKLNLVSERFDDVTVALLDEKGCPTFKQTISGPFGSPRAGNVSAVESLAGPIFNLYKKAKRFVQAGKCEVFYNGAVQQPR